MRIIELQQGTPEWHAHRGASHNASEAPVMMGVAAKLKRSELIRMKATGGQQEFSRWVEEVLFERGHEVEAAARPIAEQLLGEELFPATAVSEEHAGLSASFDGISMDERVVWECKQWNDAKATIVRAGKVPQEDYWQCVQQLIVSRADRLVYMVSNGMAERTVHCELRLDPKDEKALLAGWRQFDADVAAYKPDPSTPVVVGRAPEDNLPALLISVTGAVTSSNLPEFKERALAVFDGLSTDLQTDSDFADAEKAVKFCSGIEERLDGAKQQALAQTATINALFLAIDEVIAAARAKRLALNKLVTDRKAAVRLEHVRGGEKALRDHIDALNKRLARVTLPQVPADFAGSIRGLKTVASIKDAIATELARGKIAANEVADRMEANLRLLGELAAGYETLFSDMQSLVVKSPDDLAATIKARIADHEAEAQRRREAEQRRLAAAPPQPAAAQPNHAPAVMAPPAQAPKHRMRANGPTGAQMIGVLAEHYRVHESKVIEWLLRVDLKAESERMVAAEFR